jgi:hypothetical protein
MIYNSPIYITFYCSGDHCNKEFNMLIKNKTFANIRYGLARNIKQMTLVCCPYCDHYQYLEVVDFLQIDKDRYFAI